MTSSNSLDQKRLDTSGNNFRHFPFANKGVVRCPTLMIMDIKLFKIVLLL